MSGAGFGRATSSKEKTRPAKASASPSRSSFAASSARAELEATAIGSPAAATARTASGAPGMGTASRCMASAMRSESVRAQRAGSGPTRRSITGIITGSAMPRNVSLHASGEMAQPRAVSSSDTSRFTSPSLSASTPSQSNTTAAGRNGDAVTPLPGPWRVPPRRAWLCRPCP